MSDIWDPEQYRGAWRMAADQLDRFRDVLADCLGHSDENPGDEVLLAELREHFGKTGPEPTRWRDFLTGAESHLDQIVAERRAQRRAEIIDANEEGQ